MYMKENKYKEMDVIFGIMVGLLVLYAITAIGIVYLVLHFW